MRRDAFLWATGLVVVAVVTASVFVGWKLWRVGSGTGDIAAIEGAVAGWGAFLLGSIAAVVALIAYAVSTRRPRLEVSVKLPFSQPNRPVLPYRDTPGMNLLQIDDAPTRWTARLSLRNRSRWAADSPHVKVELINMVGVQPDAGWSIVEQTRTAGIRVIEWNGAEPVYLERQLPDLNFSRARVRRQAIAAVALRITLAAEGFRHGPSDVKIRALPTDEWRTHLRLQTRSRWRRLIRWFE